MGNPEHRMLVAQAACFAVTVMLVSVGVAAGAIALLALRRGATLAEAWAQVLGSYPGQAAVAVVVGAATLTLLLVFSPPSGRWGLGSRSALAGYVGIVAAVLSLLLVAEWIPGQPGAAGGAAIALVAILGFTVAGGPLWIGFIAVLLGRTALLPRGVGTERLSSSERSWFGTILMVAGLGVAALVVAGAYLVAVHGGLDYACAVEGPFLPLAEMSERSGVVTGSFSWWPLGRSCTWAAAGGSSSVLTTSSWANTVFVVVLLGVAAAGVALRTNRPRQTDAPATDSPL